MTENNYYYEHYVRPATLDFRTPVREMCDVISFDYSVLYVQYDFSY